MTTTQDVMQKDMTRVEDNRDEQLSTRDIANGNMTSPSTPVEGTTTNTTNREPLFPQNELGDFRSRWERIQAGFVDEPRHAVEEADHLVASVVKRVAEVFAGERERMEKQWGQQQDVSTEDFRQALRRYRSFFDRLLSA